MKNPSPIPSDLKALISGARTRRTKIFAYGCVFAFVACTAFLAFNPSSNSSSPWFYNFFSSSSASSLKASFAPYRSQVSSLISHLFPNSSSSAANQVDSGGNSRGSSKGAILGTGSVLNGALGENRTQVRVGSKDKGAYSGENGVLGKNHQVKNGSASDKKTVGLKKDGALVVKNQTVNPVGSKGSEGSKEKQGKKEAETTKGAVPESKNQTANRTQVPVGSKEKGADSGKNGGLGKNHQVKNGTASDKNTVGLKNDGALVVKNQAVSSVGSKGSGGSKEKQGKKESEITKEAVSENKNQTATNEVTLKSNGVSESTQKGSKANSTQNGQKGIGEGNRISNSTSSLGKRNGSAMTATSAKAVSDGNGKKRDKWIEDMIGCDIFHGHWVKDDSYPLYPEGSCPHIDEPFDCYHNGRPDRSYQKLRWQPTGCNIPRLNATDMLERLRGKRLVFVGDSLNRNMWESLVCVLRNSVKDKKKVFEASGRHEFRTEGSYSFLFKDYGATVEFFRSPFLVQEWEMPSGNGTKETLRLDIIERSSSMYKDAHVIIFNTGHWWTHEKTSKGKDYYQEGNRVYSELNVVEAFHKALNTWAKWVDANVNPKKSLVSFRGYSASHFSGGQWNSGGACDKETEPIKNEKYLSSYPPKMSVLESVIKGMKTPVAYLNITRMTDYRKDAHPSVYRKQNLTEEERRDPLSFQDCSHWCLPGVPDTWNELLYAQLIIKQYQMAQ